jgi:hypothetical protein
MADMEPGMSWFYIEHGPKTTEDVKEAFDHVFLNCVAKIVEHGPSYWVFVDMGRQCNLLAMADEQIKKDKFFIVNGWNVTYGVPEIS